MEKSLLCCCVVVEDLDGVIEESRGVEESDAVELSLNSMLKSPYILL